MAKDPVIAPSGDKPHAGSAGALLVGRSRWLPLLLLPPAAVLFAWPLPAWGLMWAIALAIFAGCKWLTWCDGRAVVGKVPWKRSLAYLLLWPGMDAGGFLNARSRPEKPEGRAWFFAGLKILFGALLVWGVAHLLPGFLLQGWTGMVGLIFLLHFGAFHLLALIWQSAGIDARPLMRMPIAARSLGEFWGLRWNRGFNDLVRRNIFEPLLRPCGIATATLLTFFASGLVHEAAISLPPRGGYGLPTLYFLLQGACVLAERSAFGRAVGLRRGVRGRMFVLVATAAPAGLLFPPIFVEHVMLPFLKIIHAV